MLISARPIGQAHPPYIIAELGVNHDGSVERALHLTRAAAEAGADAIKLQLFEADRLMSRAARLAAYQKAAGESDPIQMLRRLELTIDEMETVVRLAHDLGIHAIVTVFSVELVPAAERLPWDAYKTASPDIVHKPLLEALAATGKPIIVSTGASTIDEVKRTADWLHACGDRLALLQCVSAYPTPPECASVYGMLDLQRCFAGPVGYSDHAAGHDAGMVAAAIGACILERHVTYSRSAAGPDHAASDDPADFKVYASNARKLYRCAVSEGVTAHRWKGIDPRVCGPDRKIVHPIEQDVRAVSRQSITTTRDLPAGHALTRADLTFKRPGAGIPPWRLDELLGRPLARPVEADTPLTNADLSPP